MADDGVQLPIPHQRPELTGRAIIAGILVGSLLCFTNCYLGLQSAWISMSSMQSALVGFGLVKLLPSSPSSSSSSSSSSPPSSRLTRRFWRWYGQGSFSTQENVVLQATAVALGSMPLTVGLIGVIPALKQLNPIKDHGAIPVSLTGPHLLLWSAALAFFGVFFASPLRKRAILKERLTFPSGTATAHLISVLHETKLRDGASTSSALVSGTDSPRSSSIFARHRRTGGDRERQPLLESAPEQQRGATAYHSHNGSDANNGSSGDDHSGALGGSQSWKTLVLSFAASSIFTLLSALFPVLYAIPIFDVLPPHNLTAKWGWYFTPSLSYIGQGIIMGLHTTTSMLAGAIFGWAFLSPLAHHSGWTDRPPMDGQDGSKGWILWISLAIMTSESFVGLAIIIASELKAAWTGAGDDESDAQDEPPSCLPPTRTIVTGLLASSIFAVVALWALFGREGIEPYTSVIAIVLAFALSVLAVRALGSTDLNPVAALGKMSQLLFAVLQPHNIVANMIAGGLSEAGAMQAGELMQDFKTGHLTLTSPRSQFYGQLIGSFCGIFVSTFAYQLYVKVYTIPSPSFPAPAASMWLNFARLVNDGEIPRHSREWMIGCALVFAVTGSIKAAAQARASKRQRQGANDDESAQPRWEKWAWYLPSGIAFAVGILNTPNFSIARFFGGLISFWWTRRHRHGTTNDGSSLPSQGHKIALIIVASGFVLGEGASSIVNLLAKQVGLRAVSCFGCRGACGGGC